MAPLLYVYPASPAVRAVQMTSKAIGLTLNETFVDLFNRGQYTPEFLQMNPQHCVPVLVDDDGFTIWNSNVIVTYLVSKYAKDDSLYPKNLKQRAQVDNRLHLNSEILFPTLAGIVRPVYFEGKTEFDDRDREKAETCYGILEALLEREWIAGDSLTVADFCLFATVSSLNFVVPIDGGRFSKVLTWFKMVDGLPVSEINRKGLQEYIQLVQKYLKLNIS